MDDPKRERKRKEIATRLSREMGEHRDECVFFLPPFSLWISSRIGTLADVGYVDLVLEGTTRRA